MTDTLELPEDLVPLIGERIHCLDPAGMEVVLERLDDDHFGYPRTMTLRRGQELVLDEKILLASLNRLNESYFSLDEYAQRDRYHGIVRWNFGEYPDGERSHDLRNAPDETRLIQKSTTIASYTGTRGDADVRGGLRPGLRAQW